MDLLRGVLAKCVLRDVVHGRADHGEPSGQRALLGEVVDRRQELAATQVSGRAEDDHHRRICDPVVVQSFG